MPKSNFKSSKAAQLFVRKKNVQLLEALKANDLETAGKIARQVPEDLFEISGQFVHPSDVWVHHERDEWVRVLRLYHETIGTGYDKISDEEIAEQVEIELTRNKMMVELLGFQVSNM